MSELKRGDWVRMSDGRRLLVDGFSEDHGTRLSDGSWICASELEARGSYWKQVAPQSSRVALAGLTADEVDVLYEAIEDRLDHAHHYPGEWTEEARAALGTLYTRIRAEAKARHLFVL